MLPGQAFRGKGRDAPWQQPAETALEEVWGLGFRVKGLGFRVQGSGFKVRVIREPEARNSRPRSKNGRLGGATLWWLWAGDVPPYTDSSLVGVIIGGVR